MITIRKATPNDSEIIAHHNQEAAKESENLVIDNETALLGAEAVLLDPTLGFYLIAEKNGEIAGSLMITYEWRDWRNAISWWIQSVYTRPLFRKQGVYKALYDYVRTMAIQESVFSLRLYAESNNTNALQVYKKMGMKTGEYLIFDEILDE